MINDRELGDLSHIRAALVEIEVLERGERERRGDIDPVARALGDVRRRLVRALADAAQPTATLTPAEYAQLTGCSLWTAYKRVRRGQIPGAKKVGGSVVIPVEAAA
jgi:predicted DNA-binding transcriptional regulator AlpA